MSSSDSSPSFPIHRTDDAPDLPEDDLAALAALGQDVVRGQTLKGRIQAILTSDPYIRSLNATFRHKDAATDVLSFDLGADEETPLSGGGEVYISIDSARRQADEQGVALLTELARLLVHGLLHLAGYRHETPEQRRQMESQTDHWLRAAGLSGSDPSP